MAEITKYSLILQNSASKKVEIIKNLVNHSNTRLAYKFDFDLPQNLHNGEYRYILVPFVVSSVDHLSSDCATITTEDGNEILISKANAEIGILKIKGEEEVKTNYENRVTNEYYE